MSLEVGVATDRHASGSWGWFKAICDTSALSLLTFLKDSRSMLRTVRTCTRHLCMKIEAAARNGSLWPFASNLPKTQYLKEGEGPGRTNRSRRAMTTEFCLKGRGM